MASLSTIHGARQPLHLSLPSNRLSFPKPISSLSFHTPPPPSSSSPFKLSTVRASSSGAPLHRNPRISPGESLNPIFKTACITLTAAAALFLSRLHTKPAIASPIAAPPLVEPAPGEAASEQKDNGSSLAEEERALEEHLAQHPDDIDALRALMELKIKSRKLPEAIGVIDRLMQLEPDDDEWQLLKAQIYSYSGDSDSSTKIFEEVLEKDPLRVEAYHGLVMAYSEDGRSMSDVMKRIEAAMNKCKKEKNASDARDFKLLLAQIRVMEEKYGEALNVYDELVKEEPRDFRPYLCQGIIYTLMRKREEAEKKFEQFKKLVPKNHPYREYFLDNMFATKFFSDKVDTEKAWARS
ncbi:unnamed protein product [Linum tenue]|uniref:Chloroplast lumen common family protein n=1 Tax=Linum tenue TaxID=586396 RepID=A0AAV0PQ42_9ROSI|nr:unnamed protein product [Linum tenue]